MKKIVNLFSVEKDIVFFRDKVKELYKRIKYKNYTSQEKYIQKRFKEKLGE